MANLMIVAVLCTLVAGVMSDATISTIEGVPCFPFCTTGWGPAPTTQAPTDAPTDPPTEPSTAAPTDPPTEPSTAAPTEAPTDPPTPPTLAPTRPTRGTPPTRPTRPTRPTPPKPTTTTKKPTTTTTKKPTTTTKKPTCNTSGKCKDKFKAFCASKGVVDKITKRCNQNGRWKRTANRGWDWSDAKPCYDIFDCDNDPAHCYQYCVPDNLWKDYNNKCDKNERDDFERGLRSNCDRDRNSRG